MQVFACGDTHCPIDIHKLSVKNWPEQKEIEFTKEDILMVTGDFGLLWAPDWDNEELYWAKWLTEKPFTTCFVDGNHENFTRLAALPEIDFHGGKVGVAYEDANGRILHMKRGEIFIFDDKKIFTFGGATSTDKERRLLNISWWPEEVPNHAECEYALSNLEKHGNEVDFIITHTAPNTIIHALGFDKYSSNRFNDPTAAFLEEIKKITLFKQWHFGHFHASVHKDQKFICHYNWEPYKLF